MAERLEPGSQPVMETGIDGLDAILRGRLIQKRTGRHERTIRELKLSSDGMTIGEPLREFEVVLTGLTSYVGASLNKASGDD